MNLFSRADRMLKFWSYILLFWVKTAVRFGWRRRGLFFSFPLFQDSDCFCWVLPAVRLEPWGSTPRCADECRWFSQQQPGSRSPLRLGGGQPSSCVPALENKIAVTPYAICTPNLSSCSSASSPPLRTAYRSHADVCYSFPPPSPSSSRSLARCSSPSPQRMRFAARIGSVPNGRLPPSGGTTQFGTLIVRLRIRLLPCGLGKGSVTFRKLADHHRFSHGFGEFVVLLESYVGGSVLCV